MFELKKNYPGLSYITAISKAQSTSSIINLTGEFASETPPLKLIDSIVNTFNQKYDTYDMDGYYPLREIASNYFYNKYSYRYNPETEITITSGYHQAISTTISALVKEGDEVIIFEPSYYTYIPIIEANGGRPVYVQLKTPDFHINWDDVQKLITTRTKLIVINSPHHVSGSILSATDMERLNKIINGTKIMILSDEIYGSIIFEGYEHQSIARYPKLAERTYIISGPSKTLNTDSWQISYCLAPERLMSSYRKAQHFQLYSANFPLQIALANYLKQEDLISDGGKNIQAKRDLLLKNLKNSKLTFQPSMGSFFQLFNYSRISDLKDVAFCQHLMDKHQLNVMPLSFFYHETNELRYFRVNFAKMEDEISQANSILLNLI